MSSVRILHVSDSHLGGTNAGDESEIIKKFLDDVRTFCADSPPDLVVFSGDITFSGRADDFRRARDELILPLLEMFGLTRDRIILVPGNHDVERDGISRFLESGLRADLTSNEAVEALLDGAEAENALSRLSNWDEFHKDFYAGCDQIERSKLAFWQTVNVKDLTIGVAGLNSAWRCSSDEDQNRLILGDIQTRDVLNRFDQVDLTLVAVHHPTDWLIKWDEDAARIAFEARHSIVLFGHVHEAAPAFVATARGSAIYAQSGCLCATSKFRNGYSVLDVDPSSEIEVSLRAWIPERRTFDMDTIHAQGGSHKFSFPTGDNVPVMAGGKPVAGAFSAVHHYLTEKFATVLTSPIEESNEERTLSEILVEPRLLALPYQQFRAAQQLDRDAKLERIDPSKLIGAHLVLLEGEHESGLSSALLWLLHSGFMASGRRLPIYVRFEGRFSVRRFERDIRKQLAEIGFVLDREDDIPPLTIAVDDVTAKHAGAFTALGKYIQDHPEHRYVLGSHSNVGDRLRANFEGDSAEITAAYMGPFGRRETQDLVNRLASGPGDSMLARITEVVISQGLPRNPFVLTALVAVMNQQADLRAINESGLLYEYATLLLSAVDPSENLGMDLRTREHLLGFLAQVLIEQESGVIQRLDAESHLTEHFQRLGWTQHSPGRVIDSLIRRRLLVEDEGVRFRHPAFLLLFAGSRMNEDDAFREKMMTDPIRYAEVIRHSAGLDRTNRELLETVRSLTARDAVETGIDPSSFSLLSDKPGWSGAPDAAQLRERLEAFRPDDEAFEKHLDDAYERSDEKKELDPATPTSGIAIEDLEDHATLLGQVLKSSELVQDRGLKRDAFKQAIEAWSLLAIFYAAQEDQDEQMRKRLHELFDDESAPERAERIDRMADLMIMVIMCSVAAASTGAMHLEGLIRESLADGDFRGSAVHALMATSVYAQMRLRDWPIVLGQLVEEHGTHPVVREIALAQAMTAYQSKDMSSTEVSQLETFLADYYTRDWKAKGPGAGSVRAQNKSKILDQLRKARTKSLRKGSDEADDLVVVESPSSA